MEVAESACRRKCTVQRWASVRSKEWQARQGGRLPRQGRAPVVENVPTGSATLPLRRYARGVIPSAGCRRRLPRQDRVRRDRRRGQARVPCHRPGSVVVLRPLVHVSRRAASERSRPRNSLDVRLYIALDAGLRLSPRRSSAGGIWRGDSPASARLWASATWPTIAQIFSKRRDRYRSICEWSPARECTARACTPALWPSAWRS